MTRPLVIHVINSLTIGGAEVLLKNTVNLLKNYKHVIVYLNEPDMLKDQFEGDVEFYGLNHSNWSDSFATKNKLSRIIAEKEPALVHAHLFDATLLARFATPRNIPFFFTIHNILSKDAFQVNRLSLLAEKWSYKKHQNIIAVSKEVLRDYHKWVGLKGCSHVLYNYVDQSFFDLQYNSEQDICDDFRLVAVGNLRRQKNYENLLQAFGLLKHLPVHLDIYGDGDLEEVLQQHIQAKNLNVELKGVVNSIASVISTYHAFIMPSVFEGFGIAPMEAMAVGMPVLLSDIEVFKEIAGDKPIYFDPKDPSSIAKAIEFTYINWQSILSRSKYNKELARSLVSKEVYINQLESIYKTTS